MRFIVVFLGILIMVDSGSLLNGSHPDLDTLGLVVLEDAFCGESILPFIFSAVTPHCPHSCSPVSSGYEFLLWRRTFCRGKSFKQLQPLALLTDVKAEDRHEIPTS
jgi:hypothetical protein